MNLKKKRRYIKFILKIYVLQFLNFFLSKINYNILPKIDKKRIPDIQHSKKSNTFYLKPIKNKINIYRLDTSNVYSSLCKLGLKYNSDKSPFSKTWHRHSYTGFYDILFSSFKEQKFNFAEIGIYKNSSIRMFREYFKNASLFGFDNNKKYLVRAKKQKIKNTTYSYIDVQNEKKIQKSFKKLKKKFRVIIDDSSHNFLDQINIIKVCKDFLEPGGYLIIEDIYFFKNIEEKFIKNIQNYLNSFVRVDFIELNHINQYSSGWITNNDKILLIQKKYE